MALVRDDPEKRYRLAHDFYAQADGALRRYGVAELSFLRCVRGTRAPVGVCG
jgi:hypothetical protein